MIGWTAAHAAGLLTVALRHPNVKLIANALGTPPPDVVERVQGAGLMIGALAGSVKHALNHKAAGLDFIICQGSEGGGHTGDVGSIVLWPEVVDAVAPIPVLAAGGVGSGRQMAAAMALGAQGVWSGTLWLTVEEADIPPKQMETYLAASSRDTVRSRSFTGKPCRMLKNDWTDAWEAEDTPDPLPMPLQMMVAIEAVSRGPPLPRTGQGRELQPVRPGHRTGHHGPQGQGRRLLDGRGVPRGHRAAAGRGDRLIRTGGWLVQPGLHPDLPLVSPHDGARPRGRTTCGPSSTCGRARWWPSTGSPSRSRKASASGIVGESGCGKSTTGLSIMRLLPSNGHITGGSIRLLGSRSGQVSTKRRCARSGGTRWPSSPRTR